MQLPDLITGLPYSETLMDRRDELRRTMAAAQAADYPFGRPVECVDGYIPPAPLFCATKEHSLALSAIGCGTKWTIDMQRRTGYRNCTFAECYNEAGDDERANVRRLFPGRAA